jgi:hypothetical protein
MYFVNATTPSSRLILAGRGLGLAACSRRFTSNTVRTATL